MERCDVDKLGLDYKTVKILISEYIDGECNCAPCREKRYYERFWDLYQVKNHLPFIPRGLDQRENYATDRHDRQSDWRGRYKRALGTRKVLEELHLYNYRRVANYKRYGTKHEYCSDCGKVMKATESETIIYNPEYAENNYRRFESQMIEGKLCSECLTYYKLCNKCGKYHYDYNFLRVCFDKEAISRRRRYGVAPDGDEMCITCYNKDWKDCSRCGISVSRATGHPYRSERGNDNSNYILCDACHAEYLAICERCNKHTYRFLLRSDTEELRMCPKCFNQCIPIHDYAFKPESVVRKGKKNPKVSKDTLLFGVELEVENLYSGHRINTSTNAMAHIFLNIIGRDIWYIKTDGSLRYGIELVSHPFSWSQFKEDKPIWSKVCDLLTEHKYGASARTGMHVHMSKSAFTTVHLYKFIKFIYEDSNREFMYAIAERIGTPINSYCRYHDEDLEGCAKTAKDKRNNSGQRHSAVSLLYKPTAEIRIFQSSVSPSVIYKNLEFCKSLFEFSKDSKINDMVAYKFVQYLQKHSNQYPNLLNFITRDLHIHHHYPVIKNVLKKGE